MIYVPLEDYITIEDLFNRLGKKIFGNNWDGTEIKFHDSLDYLERCLHASHARSSYPLQASSYQSFLKDVKDECIKIVPDFSTKLSEKQQKKIFHNAIQNLARLLPQQTAEDYIGKTIYSAMRYVHVWKGLFSYLINRKIKGFFHGKSFNNATEIQPSKWSSGSVAIRLNESLGSLLDSSSRDVQGYIIFKKDEVEEITKNPRKYIGNIRSINQKEKNYIPSKKRKKKYHLLHKKVLQIFRLGQWDSPFAAANIIWDDLVKNPEKFPAHSLSLSSGYKTIYAWLLEEQQAAIG